MQYVDMAYSREHEEQVPWAFDTLGDARASETCLPSQFYPASQFKLAKRDAIRFPQCVAVSNNYFNTKWSGSRRIKNTVMVLDWVPNSLTHRVESFEPLTEDQRNAVETAL